MRPQPEWLITDDVEHTEVELGTLKTGKEAEVFLIERSFNGRSCLLAHKRYRPAVWFIDFPQAVDVTVNPHAFDFLYRDVTNVCAWFGREGIDVDADELFAELVAMTCR